MSRRAVPATANRRIRCRDNRMSRHAVPTTSDRQVRCRNGRLRRRIERAIHAVRRNACRGKRRRERCAIKPRAARLSPAATPIAACLLAAALIAPGAPAAADSISVLTQSPLEYEKPQTRCATEICQSLKRLLERAENTIDFAVYGIRGQPEILAALVAAQRRGVRVRGVVDKMRDGRHYYSDTPLLAKRLGRANIRNDRDADQQRAKQLDRGQRQWRDKCERPAGHEGPLQCFEGRGYASRKPIKFAGDIMHHKFFVVDGRHIWTGSANISNTGAGGYNANVVAVVDSPPLAAAYTAEFEQMFVTGRYHRLKKRGQTVRAALGDDTVEALFSPQDKVVTSRLLPLIQNARKSIDLAIFFLTHNELSRALAAAKKRGLRVRVILDATGAANEYSKHDYLREEGVALKVETWGGKMHAKTALIDGETLILGSMNWTKAGAQKNDENTLIIRSPTVAQHFAQYFETLWASIPNRWLHADPRPESPDSGTACRDGIDNDWDKAVDGADESCRK